MMIKIYPYNPKSKAAKVLATTLDVKRIKHKASNYVGQPGHMILNWGANQIPQQVIGQATIINPPDVVRDMTDKLSFFNKMQGNNFLPEFTTDKQVAADWIRDGQQVVCRQMLRASGGRGIVVASFVEDLVDAPLYVLYKKKKEEYRVHVFQGRVIDVQKKGRRLTHANPNWRVRNHDNGFVYVRYNINPPHQVIDAALECMANTELDFGAVDVIYNQAQSRAYVLEINTAPGLEGSTVGSYVEAIRDVY